MKRPGEFRFPSIPALALYTATVIAEAPVIFTRMLLTFAVAVLVLLVKGEPLGGAGGVAELALIPTGWALLALITPFGGGWWWAQNLGGRDPSERERIAYQDALDLLLHSTTEHVRLPGFWFVIDTPHPDAAVCGNALMLSRGMLESEYLPAVLAHELGHINTSDGKLTAAINRLIINPLPKTREKQQTNGRDVVIVGTGRMLLTITAFGALLWILRRLIVFARGGVALRFFGPLWGSYWREREYIADQYAARLGQAEELADFLDIHALIHDHPVPFIWLTEHTHPPTELRIDKLRKTTLQPPTEVAPGPEPVKAAPPGPPAAGPDGPTLTEPDPSAEESLRSAGMALPTTGQTDHGRDTGR
jgi:Zn-dependent protease with chaperone function